AQSATPDPSCLALPTPVERTFDTRSSPVSLVPRLAAYSGKLTHREQQVSPVCPSDLARYSILLGHSARVRVSPPCRTLMAQRPALDVRGQALDLGYRLTGDIVGRNHFSPLLIANELPRWPPRTCSTAAHRCRCTPSPPAGPRKPGCRR